MKKEFEYHKPPDRDDNPPPPMPHSDDEANILPSMKTISSYWFSTLTGCIGIIVGEDGITGERKAYIGLVSGFNEYDDTEHIKAYGSPIYAEMLREIADKLV